MFLFQLLSKLPFREHTRRNFGCRRLPCGLFLGALVFIFSVAPPTRLPALTMFRGNAAHTGIYPGIGLRHMPRIKWQYHTGGPVLSSPAIDGPLLYVGSSDGKMYALDRRTGVLQWAFKTGARITSSPAVDEDSVYFGSMDGKFYSVDRRTGRRKWVREMSGERRFEATHLHGYLPAAELMPDPFDVYLSSPTIWNGFVYVGSGDTYIYAFDARTGVLRWKFKTKDVVHSSPAVSGGTLYVGSWDTYLYALNATSGELKWRFKTGEDRAIHNQTGIQSSPVVVGGRVYFGCRDNFIYALDAASGHKMWAVPNQGSWVISSPAVYRGNVYYATADTAEVVVVDAKTGAQRKRLRLSKWYYFASPAISDGMLYMANWDGSLRGIDVSTDRVSWTFRTLASQRNLPRFLKADGSRRFHLRPTDGFYDDLVSAVGQIFEMGGFLSSPAVADNTVFIGSTDGNVYALQ